MLDCHGRFGIGQTASSGFAGPGADMAKKPVRRTVTACELMACGMSTLCVVCDVFASMLKIRL